MSTQEQLRNSRIKSLCVYAACGFWAGPIIDQQAHYPYHGDTAASEKAGWIVGVATILMLSLATKSYSTDSPRLHFIVSMIGCALGIAATEVVFAAARSPAP
ncbi:MAG: hypothetical protein K0U29_07585 [Gammaproteobacteria bacterium]|nr:hypothetical protein [Gammaproteobacteria bacterium]MCH9744774.1 hypothetical protein [Gammaproteobacteria bacterium]